MVQNMIPILEQYLSALILFILAVVTVVAFILINKFMAPKRSTTNQFEGINSFVAYECGEVPIGEAQSRFNFQYYVFALVFVVFDVVSSLLVAWALIINDSTTDSIAVVISASVFVVILLVGFIYWWKRNALRWM